MLHTWKNRWLHRRDMLSSLRSALRSGLHIELHIGLHSKLHRYRREPSAPRGAAHAEPSRTLASSP